MQYKLVFFVMTILNIFLLSSCDNPQLPMINFQVNFDGKDFACEFLKSEKEYSLLRCSSNDQYQLYVEYINRVKHGSFRIVYPDNSLFIEGVHVNGKKEGIWKEYFENGELKSFSYAIQDIEFYNKSYDENGNNYSGLLPVEMNQYNYKDSTELEFILAYSNLDTFYTGGVFKYRLDEERRIEHSKSSEANRLRLKIPKSFQGEINIDFLELDTSYYFWGGDELLVKVDSLHSNIELFDNILSTLKNIDIINTHKSIMTTSKKKLNDAI